MPTNKMYLGEGASPYDHARSIQYNPDMLVFAHGGQPVDPAILEHIRAGGTAPLPTPSPAPAAPAPAAADPLQTFQQQLYPQMGAAFGQFGLGFGQGLAGGFDQLGQQFNAGLNQFGQQFNTGFNQIGQQLTDLNATASQPASFGKGGSVGKGGGSAAGAPGLYGAPQAGHQWGGPFGNRNPWSPGA